LFRNGSYYVELYQLSRFCQELTGIGQWVSLKLDGKSGRQAKAPHRGSRSPDRGNGRDCSAVPSPSRERGANALRHASAQPQPGKRYRVWLANGTFELSSPPSCKGRVVSRFQSLLQPCWRRWSPRPPIRNCYVSNCWPSPYLQRSYRQERIATSRADRDGADGTSLVLIALLVVRAVADFGCFRSLGLGGTKQFCHRALKLFSHNVAFSKLSSLYHEYRVRRALGTSKSPSH